MSSFGWHFDQHSARYNDARTALSRTAALAIVFAVVVLAKVVAPFAQLTQDRHQAAQQKAAQITERDEAGRRSADLSEISLQFDAVVQAIKAQPWNANVADLKVRFRELGNSYDAIRPLPPTKILEAYQTRDEVRSREVLQTEQMSPRERLQQPRLRSLEERTLSPGDGGGRLARRPLEGGTGASAEPDGDETERRLLVAEAADLLRLNPERVSQAIRQSPADWHRTVYEEAAAEEAKAAVRSIFDVIADRVLRAIQGLLALPATTTALPDLPQQLSDLTTTVEKWRDDRLTDLEWYRTALGKEDELHRLTLELVDATRPIGEALAAQWSEAQRQHAALEQELSTANDRIAELEQAVEAIDQELEGHLPEWMRGLFAAREMIQLYPFVILGLLAFMGVTALAADGHHREMLRILKEKGETVDPSATGSIWLLRQSGLGARATSAALYLGGIAVFWFLFEQGAGHLRTWAALEPAAAWLNVEAARIILWLGRGAFIAAAASTAAIILRGRD